MGFLTNFFKNVFHEETADNTTVATSSFDRLSNEELEAHLGVSRYGKFQLTDAIRPSYDLKVMPQQGYRHDVYVDEESGARMPVLMVSASKEILFELFIELLEPLGEVVDVVLETSHRKGSAGHSDLYREHMDRPVLLSTLYDFEEMLTNDGCTGIAVLNPHIPQEVQFDEHKLIIIYGDDITRYERILEAYDILCDDNMRFITEAEHVHSSSDAFREEFEQLSMRLGMDSHYGSFSH